MSADELLTVGICSRTGTPPLEFTTNRLVGTLEVTGSSAVRTDVGAESRPTATLRSSSMPGDAEFLVDDIGYLTALARTDLTGHLEYSERNIVEKLFQTYTMRIERFHETWNGSQPALEWLA